MSDGFETTKPLQRLRLRFVILAVGVTGIAVVVSSTLNRLWDPFHIVYWIVPVTVVIVYEFWVIWHGLSDNHAEDSDMLNTRLGLGNTLTITRGVLIAFVAGFLFIPEPTGVVRWIPGALYSLSVLIDFFDGYVSRLNEEQTILGVTLDMEFDALGLLIAPLLAVLYGQLPVWYLTVSAARYVFVIGITLRRYRGLSVHSLQPSWTRRILAVLQMIVVSGVLFPIFHPPVTTIVASAAMIPFLIGFGKDWLIISGRFNQSVRSVTTMTD